ncbi:unnamed protein product [Arctogadus glacialis]
MALTPGAFPLQGGQDRIPGTELNTCADAVKPVKAPRRWGPPAESHFLSSEGASDVGRGPPTASNGRMAQTKRKKKKRM